MLKLAVAGAGYFSQFQYDAWERIPEVSLAGVYNRTPAKAAAMAEAHGNPPVFDDFTAMLDAVRPDIVDIITPPATHLVFAGAALDAGCHVICQKPFTENLEQASELARKAERLGKVLVVHENFRFQPWYREIRRQIEAGLLGDLYQATYRLRPGDGQGADAYLARQPFFRDMKRFLIHETGVHLIDTFRSLFGNADWVFADLRQLNPSIAGEDSGTVIFGYASGFRAVFDGNRLSDHVAENRRLTMGELVIEGSKGTLSLTGDGEILFRAFGTNDFVQLAYEWKPVGFGADCVYNLQRHVIDHIIAGTPLENAARDYLTVMACEQAIYRSSQTGCRVTVGE